MTLQLERELTSDEKAVRNGRTVILGLASAAHAASAYKGGNELFAECSSLGDQFDQGICYGFIVGVTDAMLVNNVACIPKSVQVGQVRSVVINALTADPVHRDAAAVDLVADAIAKAWKCP